LKVPARQPKRAAPLPVLQRAASSCRHRPCADPSPTAWPLAASPSPANVAAKHRGER
jgi:hypothetical protein